MGSGFFKQLIKEPITQTQEMIKDPLSAGSDVIPTNLIGANSSMAKWLSDLPGSTSGSSKTFNPEGYAVATAAKNLNNPPGGYVSAPRPYAGQAPTLTGANANYSNAAAQAASRAVAAPTPNGVSNNIWNTAALPGSTTGQTQALVRGSNAANGYSGQSVSGY
jgi:hypothetical protein